MRHRASSLGRARALVVLVALSAVATGLFSLLPSSSPLPSRPAAGPHPGMAHLPPAPPISALAPALPAPGVPPPAALGTPPAAHAGLLWRSTIFPPNPMGVHPGASGYVAPPYRSAPAPIGVSDLGIGPSGPYTYGTKSFEGNVTFDSFQTFTPTNISDADYATPDWALLQLNTVAVNVSSLASSDGTFWVQNGVHLNGTTLQFEDNVWDFTTSSLVLPSSTLQGTLGKISAGEVYLGILPALTVRLPFSIDLVNTLSSEVDGQTVVQLGYVLTDQGVTTSKVYDTVTFNGSQHAGAPQFEVNGSTPNAAGYLDDAELVLGGNGDGANANFLALNATARLLRWDATANAYRAVSSAYDFAADSSETALGVAVTYSGSTAHLVQGPSFLEGLWNTTTTPLAPAASAGGIRVHLTLSPSYAFAFATNLSKASGSLALADYSFAPTDRAGTLSTVLPPPPVGNPYVFRAWADGYASQSLNVSGNTSSTLTLAASATTLDAPVYLLGTGQGTAFGQAKVAGTGYSAPAGRLWLNATTDDLAAPFVRVNDFNATTFQLVATASLNLSLTVNGFAQRGSSFNYTNPLGRVVELPYWTQGYFFYFGRGHPSAQNLTVGGVPSIVHRQPTELPPASVQFYGESTVLAGNVTATEDAVGVHLVGVTGARLNHLQAVTGGVGLASYGSTGVTVTHATATGGDSYAFHSVIAVLNRSVTVTASDLAVTANATGVVSTFGSGLSVAALSVASNGTGLLVNATNSSQVVGLTIGKGSDTDGGSWVDSNHVLFSTVTSREIGLSLTGDAELTVEKSVATGSGATVVANATGSNGATYTDVRANGTATALVLEHCNDLTLGGITATNGSTGVVVSSVQQLTAQVIDATGGSVGLYVNSTTNARIDGVAVSDLSVGVFAGNSTFLVVNDVSATNVTLGASWNFTNASQNFFPVAGVGLSNVTNATITNVTAVRYPFAVWSANSTQVTVRSVTSLYGGEAVQFALTNYSYVSRVFGFGDQLGLALDNCTRTTVKWSTLERAAGPGLYMPNGSYVKIVNDTFVGNNGSSTSGSFQLDHDQGWVNGTHLTIKRNYWADRSAATYLINPNASIRDPNPRATPPSYYLEFLEHGLPSGSVWSLAFGGTTYTTADTMLLLPGWAVSVGSAAFAVGLVAGYPAHPTAGTVTWNWANQTITITFGNPSSPTSIPLWVYAAGGGAAVAALAAVLLLRRRRRAPPPPPPRSAPPSPAARRPGPPPPRRAAPPPPPRRGHEWSPDDPD